MYTEENTRIMSTGKMGNLKQTGGLYQCQYAGCALCTIIFQDTLITGEN